MTLAELNQNLIDKLSMMVDTVQDNIEPVKDISALAGAVAKLNTSMRNKPLLDEDKSASEEFEKQMDDLADKVGI